jgi:hypothetical protein
MIEIANKGREIVSTNYWASEHAEKGMCYLSGNAGDWRLLIPPSQSEAIKEFAAVKRASIEPSIAISGYFDVIAEDGTNAPFCISMDKTMIDRKLEKKRCRLLVYTPDGLIANMPVQVRPA